MGVLLLHILVLSSDFGVNSCLSIIYIFFFTIILSFSSFQFDVIISKHPVTDVLRGEEPIDSGHSLAV